MNHLGDIIDGETPALTISQPYASMIATGEKWVENRTWPTRYAGQLLIHAGKGTQFLTKFEQRNYDCGCIVAVARIGACIGLHDVYCYETATALAEIGIAVEELLGHIHTHGPWCWILQDVEECIPYPCRGAMGLWKFKELT